MTRDVVVMGGGVTGQLAAAYLKKRFPALHVAIIEGPRKNRPIVGESFVEVTIDFLLELGLGSYLIEKHFPKYGLTYYFKPKIDDPADRTYVVDETPTVPPFLSFQINRFTFDSEVRRRNVESDVEMIDGTVADVQLSGDGRPHRLTVRDGARQESTVEGRWLIDATGRNRVLSKRLQLEEKVEAQKDVFWFRVADFDPELFGRIHAVKKENRAFVPYFATHHFFGRGNWVWCIPLRSPEGTPLMSIGITYRKDVYPHGPIHTMEEFLEAVGNEHSMIVELVRSGRIVDTNSYSSYMWECRQHYSPDRWYIVGDAGDTVDPLYSVGVALVSVQARQIAAIIAQELQGRDTREFTRDLDTAITAFHHSVTRDTTRLYECMGDAYQCHLRVHLVVTKMFHVAIPLLLNGYLWCPAGVRVLNRLASLEALEAEAKAFHELIREAAARPENRAIENFVKVQSAASMNYPFYEYHREEDIPASLTRMAFGLARLRLALLRKLGWRGWMRFGQHSEFAKDMLRGMAMMLFRGQKLRESRLAGMIFGFDAKAAQPMHESMDSAALATEPDLSERREARGLQNGQGQAAGR